VQRLFAVADYIPRPTWNTTRGRMAVSGDTVVQVRGGALRAFSIKEDREIGEAQPLDFEGLSYPVTLIGGAIALLYCGKTSRVLAWRISDAGPSRLTIPPHPPLGWKSLVPYGNGVACVGQDGKLWIFEPA
jgi:hypothetical protein